MLLSAPDVAKSISPRQRANQQCADMHERGKPIYCKKIISSHPRTSTNGWSEFRLDLVLGGADFRHPRERKEKKKKKEGPTRRMGKRNLNRIDIPLLFFPNLLPPSSTWATLWLIRHSSCPQWTVGVLPWKTLIMPNSRFIMFGTRPLSDLLTFQCHPCRRCRIVAAWAVANTDHVVILMPTIFSRSILPTSW